ncbi:sigma-70 family RNA polymerase sigma factor [Allosphingosinicella flava]|uniref:Sigma-70 family RNA polymerase sigma factor n=1 Tax=Allosphingosinicella flava TaxID=2771430 RepID=A0A7T2LLG7_9SPHN|nr:sigma-70 family RNA polymerase sigma factor [Sphingosinicella flava]QPQ54353.1 sigma-70 family RNA polymerase sigma factor [Sphingosinicella flava]
MQGADQSRKSADRARLAQTLVKVRNGDRAAFAEVYAKTSAKLFGICLRILADRSEAEDVLQDVYVSVWQKAGGFDPGRSSPITWLASLARNRAIDRVRARGRKPAEALDREALDVADPGASALAILEAGEDRRRLTHCLGTLQDQQRGAIREAFYMGFSYAELAARKGIPLGTVKSWIRRGLISLKECLQQ